MAKLVAHLRTGKLTKVSWIEIDSDGSRVSRSKSLETEEQARTFKQLVEAAGERTPSYTALEPVGLVDFGYDIDPRVVLDLRRVVFMENLSAKDKIEMLVHLLRDM